MRYYPVYMKLKLRTGQRNVRICFDSLAALSLLQAAKTSSPLVHQCQKALNNISTRHTVGLYWVPGHAGVRGNEIADRLARDGSVQRFVGPEPFLEFSRQNIRRKMKRWMEKLHLVLWRGLVVHRDRIEN
jgi:ribonuclease HI